MDGRNLRRNLPELTTLVLSGCGVRGWNVVGELGVGCPKLEVLSLVGNPVASKFFLRRCCVVKILLCHVMLGSVVVTS